MFTLSFLWSWIKMTAGTAVALIIECVVISGAWVALAVGITLGLWLMVTVGLYREWRARGTGYRHEVAEFIGDRPDRRLR